MSLIYQALRLPRRLCFAGVVSLVTYFQRLIERANSQIGRAHELESLREKARTVISNRGMTQRELSGLIGLSETFFGEFLAGRKGLSDESITRLSVQLSALSNTPRNTLHFGSGGNTLNKGAKIVHLQERGGQKSSLETPTIPFAEFMAKNKPNKRMHI